MIANTATTMLRTGVTRTCGLQPILLRSGTTGSSSSSSTSPYSTFPASPFSARSKLICSPPTTNAAAAGTPKSILILRASQKTQRQPTTTSRRHASNSPKLNDSSHSTPHAEDAAAAARTAQRAAEAAALAGAPPLDWDTFFKLRKSRRRVQVGFSVVLSLFSGTTGAAALSSGVADSLTSQLPLDPFMTMGLMTMGFMALGWLAGPSLGSAVFYLLKRKYKVPMTVVSGFFPSTYLCALC